jgi:hypothetical protein
LDLFAPVWFSLRLSIRTLDNNQTQQGLQEKYGSSEGILTYNGPISLQEAPTRLEGFVHNLLVQDKYEINIMTPFDTITLF